MSVLKKSLIGAGVAASFLAMSGAHAAADFTVNSGYGTTSAFNVLSSNVNATSIYTSPIGAVSSIDSLIGIGAFVTDTSANGQVNSFLTGTTPLGDANDAGLGTNYRLLFSYELSGTAAILDGFPVGADGTLDSDGNGLIDSAPIFGPGFTIIGGLDAIVPNYTSGTITLTYVDMTGAVLGSVNATQKVLELKLDSATIDGPNVILNANVNYDWYTAGTSSLVEDMFNFSGQSESWYDLWATGTPSDPVSIKTRSDFNIDPNAVPVSTCGTADVCDTFTRTTNLNITTQVPEPATLALLGVSLLGFGVARKARKG